MKAAALRKLFWLILTLALLGLVGCQPAFSPTFAPVATQASKPSQAAISTNVPQTTATSTQIVPKPGTPTVSPVITPPTPSDARVIELEWPSTMRLGDSDVVRLALVPAKDGYVVQAEFPEHSIQSQNIVVVRQAGFTLVTAARLDGVGFNISPADEVEQPLPAEELVSWRWSLAPQQAGQQRLTVTLLLRWKPEHGVSGSVRQSLAFGRSLNVQVDSILGMTRPQALTTGFIGLLAGLVVTGGALAYRPRRAALRRDRPNLALQIEPFPGLELAPTERTLLQTLFNRYARLVLENEFRSGYSGARTFLALPVHADGRTDARTIVKIGWNASIEREHANYESYVKDSLPPITARIQHPPVTVAGSRQAALQYTFIAEPGRPPVSLRQALLTNPDPALLLHLFDTFGPHWWMQRKSVTFRWVQEYDVLLPPHLVLTPIAGAPPTQMTLTPQTDPASLNLAPGSLVRLGRFTHAEPRADGNSYTLVGLPPAGLAPLRLRWLNQHLPSAGTQARVTATRHSMLSEWTAGFDRFDLPDPLAALPNRLYASQSATRSIIHGDLNLENILVGPGGFLWLIDFAETREGHPLFDFAHLGAEIIAHIIAPQTTPAEYLTRLQNNSWPLLNMLDQIAGRCLANQAALDEWHTALALACLGALKYPNLNPSAKHLLYLTAAKM